MPGSTCNKPAAAHESDVSTISEGAAFRFGGRIVGSGIQYFAVIITARILGIDDFGLYMLGFTIISFAAMLSRFGLDNAAIKYVSIYKGAGEKENIKCIIYRIFKYAIVISALISCLLYFTAGLVSQRLFSKPELASVIQVLATAIPLMVIMAICWSITQGYKLVSYTVYSQNFIQPLSNLLLISLVYYYSDRLLHGVLYSWLAASVLTSFVSIYFLVKVYNTSNYTKPSKVTATEPASEVNLLKFSSSLMLITLLTSLIIWVDTVMVGYFCPTDQVGIYIAASKTAMFTGIILTSFGTIFSPIIADLHHRQESQRLESIFKFSSRWIFTLTIPLFILLVLFAKDIMTIFGSDFVTGWTVLTVVAVSYFLNASAGPVGIVLIMTGHQRFMMYNSMVVFSMNIAANFLLIPKYGAIGAAYASALSIISYNVLMLIQVYFLKRIHPYDKTFIRPFIIGVLGAICLYVFLDLYPATLIVRLMIYAPLFLVIFFCLILLTNIQADDRVVFERIKSKLRNS